MIPSVKKKTEGVRGEPQHPHPRPNSSLGQSGPNQVHRQNGRAALNEAHGDAMQTDTGRAVQALRHDIDGQRSCAGWGRVTMTN